MVLAEGETDQPQPAPEAEPKPETAPVVAEETKPAATEETTVTPADTTTPAEQPKEEAVVTPTTPTTPTEEKKSDVVPVVEEGKKDDVVVPEKESMPWYAWTFMFLLIAALGGAIALLFLKGKRNEGGDYQRVARNSV